MFSTRKKFPNPISEISACSKSLEEYISRAKLMCILLIFLEYNSLPKCWYALHLTRPKNLYGQELKAIDPQLIRQNRDPFTITSCTQQSHSLIAYNKHDNARSVNNLKNLTSTSYLISFLIYVRSCAICCVLL